MQKNTIYNKNAITLISLVITIIILIILAGVAINLSIGENGIFRRAKIAKEQYEEAQAREKLETVLMEAVIEKETNGNYNNKEFLDNMLEEKGIAVNEDTVIAEDGKEETRKIIEKTEEIIRTANELAQFRDKVNTGLTYEGKIIKLGNDIDLGGVCGENVNGKEINWKPIGDYENNEATEVNGFKGSFNGDYNTIKNLYININENNISENYLHGNDYFGLFGYNLGIIENVKMQNVNIYVDYSNSSKASEEKIYIGSLVGENEGNIRNIGIESGNITSINNVKSTIEYRPQAVGGVVGGIYVEPIDSCYNNANITVINTSEGCLSNIRPTNMVGGIAGNSLVAVWNCYNTGSIIGNNSQNNMVGGVVGRLQYGLIGNSYNKAKIIAQGGTANKGGGIAGENGHIQTAIGTIKNSYCTNTSAQYSNYEVGNGKNNGIVEEGALKGYSETLGAAFISDGKKIDKNGNIVDNLDSNGNIIYINDGYPILKWQVTER